MNNLIKITIFRVNYTPTKNEFKDYNAPLINDNF